MDGLAGVSGYLGLSSVDRTTEEEVVPSPCQPPSLLGLEGAGAWGQQGNPEKALSPAGLHLRGLAPPAPSPQLPSVLALLTDSYLPAAGHAPQQPTADKMLM